MSKKPEDVSRLNPEEEVVLLPPDETIEVDFRNPPKDEMDLDHFTEQVKKVPSLGFNSYQSRSFSLAVKLILTITTSKNR